MLGWREWLFVCVEDDKKNKVGFVYRSVFISWFMFPSLVKERNIGERVWASEFYGRVNAVEKIDKIFKVLRTFSSDHKNVIDVREEGWFGQPKFSTPLKSNLRCIGSCSKYFSFSTCNYADQIKPLIQRAATRRLSSVACFKTVKFPRTEALVMRMG